MAAKLPREFFAPPDRLLRDLQIGESSFVAMWDMSPDADGNCFLNPQGRLFPTSDGSALTVGVKRTESGFGVTLRKSAKLNFKPDDKHEGWYPVESISVVD